MGLETIRFCKTRIVILFTSILAFGVGAIAAPGTFSYQGRITSTAGGSPGFASAAFIFSIMVDTTHGVNPNCTIYREMVSTVPVSTDGLFDVAIGEGAADYPGSTAKITDYINGTGSMSCGEGGTATVNGTDRKYLQVQFNPGGNTSWNKITPANEIRSVPYAVHATSADKLGGAYASDFVKKTDFTACTSGDFVTYNGTAFGCGTPPTGGSSADSSYTVKGLVQFLTNAATSGIVVTNGVAQVNFGTGANQIVKLDGSGKLPAVDGSALTNVVAASATTATTATTAGSATNFTGSLAGDVSGTQGATSVDKVKGLPVVTTGAANGMVLKYSGGSLVFATDATGTSPGDAGYDAANKGIVAFDTDAATSGVTVTSGVAKLNFGTGANQVVQMGSDGKLPAIDGSKLTNLPSPSSVINFSGSLVGDVSGTQGATSVDKIKGIAVNTTGVVDGKILKYQSGSWIIADDATGGSPGVASYSATGLVQFDTDADASGVIVDGAGKAKLNFGNTVGKVVQVQTGGKLPVLDGSALTNIVADSLSGILPIASGGTGASTAAGAFAALSPLAAKGDIITRSATAPTVLTVGTDGQVLMADSAQTSGLKWGSPVASDVSGITGTGIVQRTGAGTYATLGTTAPINTSSGTAIALAYSTGLTLSSGSLVVDVGTTTGKILQVDTGNKLPVIDGSQLTNLPVPTTVANFSGSLVGDVSGTQGATSVDKIKGVAVNTSGIADGKILKYQSGSWVMSDDATGGTPANADYGTKGIVAFDTSAALSGVIVSSGTAKLNFGTSDGQVVQVQTGGKLPVLDGSNLTNLAMGSLTGTLPISKGGTGATTQFDAFNALSPLTTKGDLIVWDGSTNKNVRLPAGTDGQILSADAASTGGLKWITAPSNGVTSMSGTLPVVVTGTTTPVVSVNAATTSALGVMQVGSGLSVTAGLVSVDAANLAVNPANFSSAVPVNKGGTGATTASAGFAALSPMTAKGDIITYSGSAPAVLTVGATDGHVLMVDSASANGIKWGAVTASELAGIASTGIVKRTGAGAYTALGVTAPLIDTGTAIGLTTGAGLTVNGSNALVVDVGTTTGKIVQMDTGNKLPAVDGSQLTGITATSYSGVLPIANGGTNGSTKTAGFNNLSPLTTKGDIIYFDGSNNVRLAAGTSGQILSADTTDGVKWINAPSNGVTSMSGTLPVVVTGTTTPVVSVNAATTSTLGVVQVGSGIAVSSGTITADPANFPSLVPIAKGGTGASTAFDAFNALSPMTTKGDLIVYDGSTNKNVRLPAGTNGQILTADSSVTGGVKWAAASASGVTSVSGTAPITITGTTTPVVAISAATTSALGAVQIGSGLNVTAGGVVSIDSTSATGALLNGGNTVTAAASVGTNAAYDFKIRAGSADRIQVTASNGNVGIGTSGTVNDKLEVNGSIRGPVAYDNGTTTSIDWSRGNTQFVSTNCGSQLTFSNMRDGGVYTLAITATSTFSAACAFGQTSPDTLSGTAGTGNFYFLPANAIPSGTNSVYSFMRVGTKVYVNWSSGYQQ